jgi:hypothetical protein
LPTHVVRVILGCLLCVWTFVDGLTSAAPAPSHAIAGSAAHHPCATRGASGCGRLCWKQQQCAEQRANKGRQSVGRSSRQRGLQAPTSTSVSRLGCCEFGGSSTGGAEFIVVVRAGSNTTHHAARCCGGRGAAPSPYCGRTVHIAAHSSTWQGRGEANAGASRSHTPATHVRMRCVLMCCQSPSRTSLSVTPECNLLPTPTSRHPAPRARLPC